MAIPIIKMWKKYYTNPDEGLGSSYERIVVHNKVSSIAKLFHSKKILEVPTFGFTGISGINSLQLAKEGFDISLIDNNKERISLTKKVWENNKCSANFNYLEDFSTLPFTNNQFDLSWNFCNLWFVKDLQLFLEELTRVTSKVIFISTPNTTGLGFKELCHSGKDEIKKYLTPENVIPENYINILDKLGWDLIEWNYIDCPPWPDIGMAKEDFLRKINLGFLVKEKKCCSNNKEPMTILNYWNGTDPDFANKMLRFSWLEKYAPNIFKKYWAHHKYFVFVKRNK